MENQKPKNTVRNISIVINCFLIIACLSLVSNWQGEKWNKFYSYQSIPSVHLENSLTYLSPNRTFSGEIRGFVKFNDLSKQPKDLQQYYILTPTSKRDNKNNQIFIAEEIIKMSTLAPRSIGTAEFIISNVSINSITLTDKNGNKFLIVDEGKGIMFYDAGGDETTLITSDSDYRDFMKEFINP